MPHLSIDDTNGVIAWGPFRYAWGNPIADVELPGFTSIGWGRHSIEFGDIDQGRLGIYFTTCDGFDCHTSKVLAFL